MLDIMDVYALDDNIVLRSINDKYWALDTKFGTQYKLNQISFDILSMLDGNNMLSGILEEILKEYDIASEIFYNDVMRFLLIASEKKIITRR